MFNDFGFWEILAVAALIFVAYRLYSQTRKFSIEMVIIAAVAVGLAYAGIQSPSPDFGVN
jgi:uncharacterized membrane protein